MEQKDHRTNDEITQQKEKGIEMNKTMKKKKTDRNKAAILIVRGSIKDMESLFSIFENMKSMGVKLRIYFIDEFGNEHEIGKTK